MVFLGQAVAILELPAGSALPTVFCSSCKTSATVPPLLQRSRGGRRGQFNNFVESATVSLPRLCCERGVCG